MEIWPVQLLLTFVFDFKGNIMEGNRCNYWYIIRNIKLLNLFIPIPSNVTEVLKKGMFGVPNVKAFSELAYFFFNIIEPQKCKEYIKNWPCLNKKDEMDFRRGVYKLLSDVSAKVNCSLIKPLLPSMMISPVGPTIEDFFWRLSLYVLIHINTELDISNIQYKDPSAVSSIIKKAYFRAHIQAPFVLKTRKVFDMFFDHQEYLQSAVVEYRNLITELNESERSLKEVESELNCITDSVEIEPDIKNKLQSPKFLDDGIKAWRDKINKDVEDMESNVQSIIKNDIKLGVLCELVLDIINEKRTTLDGNKIRAVIPSTLKTELMLYNNEKEIPDNNILILDNLFKVGSEVLRTINEKLLFVDYSTFSEQSSSVCAKKCDMNFSYKNYISVSGELQQFYSKIHQEIKNYKCTNEVSLYSPLQKYGGQTPPCVFVKKSESDGVISKIVSVEGKMNNWVVKLLDEHKDERIKKDKSVIKSKKSESKSLLPTKIPFLTSHVSYKTSKNFSASPMNRIYDNNLKNQEDSATQKVAKEKFKLVQNDVKVACKSNLMNKCFNDVCSTPEKDIHVILPKKIFSSKEKCNLSNSNYGYSSCSKNFHKVSVFSTLSPLPDEVPNTSESVQNKETSKVSSNDTLDSPRPSSSGFFSSQEEWPTINDEISSSLSKDFQKLDSLNLSKDTDSDYSNIGTPVRTTSCPTGDSFIGQEVLTSPSGVIREVPKCNLRKNRPSVDALISRFMAIKSKKPNGDPDIKLLKDEKN